MLHVIKLIERRFPNRSGQIIAGMFALSALALVFGIGMLFMS